MSDLLQIVTDAGFPFADDIIHLFVGGSALHGAKVIGTDDTDIYGVYVEKPELILGLDKFEHFVYSTAAQDVRNTATDVDITLYSLRKYAALACKGNPTALHFLFAENQVSGSEWNELLPEIKKCLLSKAACKQFTGFVDAQMGRLLGTRGRGKKGQRPELEAEFGFDVKAAMHAVRLLHECIELMYTGRISLPRPERKMLVAIRTGLWSLDSVSSEVNRLFQKLETARQQSKLPDEPDLIGLGEAISQFYLKHWRRLPKIEPAKITEELRRRARENKAKHDAYVKAKEDQCPHMAGCLGKDYSGTFTSIIWHTFEDDPTHPVGLCTNCGKQWRYTDADYEEWKGKRSINKPSTGGLRVLQHTVGAPFVNPIKCRVIEPSHIYPASDVELIDEPPLDMTLHQFMLSELLKENSVDVVKQLDPSVVQNLLRQRKAQDDRLRYYPQRNGVQAQQGSNDVGTN
jgi:uncharacterized protein